MILGIDTSNYKTSAALADLDGNIVFERSEYLHVDKGKRGLRQSEAFFMHSNRLPDYISDVFAHAEAASLEAIGVSSRPRRVEGSYMPCFLAGVNAARELGAALSIPVYEFSHQEGHAAAIICSSDASPDASGRALLFHLSGGTTEFLICEPDDKGYSLEIAGGTRDISIGQLIDRAGVAMGFGFPSGMYLDRLASEYAGMKHAESEEERNRLFMLPGVVKPVKTADGYFNLSGSETQILRAIDAYRAASYHSDQFFAALSYELFDCIAVLLARSAADLAAHHGIGRVYMAGGVASSGFLRERISEKLAAFKRISAPQIIFGEPALSGDNAVGTAFLAARQYKGNKR